MIDRRTLIRNLSALPLVGGFIGGHHLLGQPEETEDLVGRKPYRDYFKELGVRTFINAAGTYTAMSGCLMRDDVMDAINYASKQYVNIDDLQDKVGARIAELLECEAATVTSGCFSALTLGLAGVLTGTDSEKASRVPTDLTGMKSEVIMQKSHHIGYAHALSNCGVKLIFVETAAELEAAINDQTAMLWFLNYGNPDGQVKYDEFLSIGKKHGIPTMIDCAADVPPKENLFKYTKMGFDLVCFSGGKGLRGPQSAGLLLGRKDLIAGARQNAAPRGDTVGRGMKVNKEECLGMLAALENFLNRDHEADWKLWAGQIQHIHDAVSSVEGVKSEIHVPEIANHVPSLNVSWDMNMIKLDGNQVREKLRMGHPSIQTVGGKESLGITTWMLNPGEERVVASRIKEILSAKA